jgi:hypothetical protein
VISGGGSKGAFGAGYLVGWHERGDRPAHDIIVGLSTGALMATAVLTGDDRALEECYTTTSTRDVYHDRCPLLVPFSDSLKSTAPFSKLLEKYLTQEVIDRVAEIAARQGRRLFAVTLNLDSGKLVVWDMSAIALDRNNPDHYRLYREVLRASAAVPVLFPPVKLGGHLHVDGGERPQSFLRDHLMRSSARRAAPAVRSTGRVDLVLNGGTTDEQARPADWLVPLAMRAMETYLRANDLADLYVAKAFADEMHLGFRCCWVPAGVKTPQPLDFDPAQMRQLFEKGRKLGKEGWWGIADEK